MARALTAQCPQCGSKKLYKDGLRHLKDGATIQRLLCRECGYRFSETQPLNEQSGKRSACQVGTVPMPGRVINLAEVEPLKDRLAGATKAVNGKIGVFAWQLKKDGLSERTIETYADFLTALSNKGANLLDPETVKHVIAKQKTWCKSTKLIAVVSYSKFAALNNINWKPPKYRPTRKLPFIPLEKEIDSLIAYCGKKTATTLHLLKETAMRIGEALRLRWIDLDFERRTVTVNKPEKHGNPRTLKISPKLIGMLKNLRQENDRVFGRTIVHVAVANFIIQKKKAARKLCNPRLLRITFHTLRHWKATMEYHQTKDILHVMQMLGHRKIDNTLIYISLEKTIFQEVNDKFHSAVAKTVNEARQLIETGFDYICTKDDIMIFRKRS